MKENIMYSMRCSVNAAYLLLSRILTQCQSTSEHSISTDDSWIEIITAIADLAPVSCGLPIDPAVWKYFTNEMRKYANLYLISVQDDCGAELVTAKNAFNSLIEYLRGPYLGQFALIRRRQILGMILINSNENVPRPEIWAEWLATLEESSELERTSNWDHEWKLRKSRKP